ncbi:hypothetical protein A3J41_02450 [candidate division TM6 bacterium RIFCSPHIGHO2_12_FULL_38_8]|nr:MAG: hypothetical protein A3J41_02450 [candidate division TM6 bacterium RIFCSPHIGHO2_12_FULL_38_8]
MYKMWLKIVVFCIASEIYSDPLLVAVLMVKNEASTMEMTLQPLVDAGIHDFLIYDTGSTDNTIQVTQDFFIQNNITNFIIEQGEFVDFATSRNKALELTDQYFPDATFLLMPDAEWILHNGDELLKFCEEQKNNSEPLYFMKAIGTSVDMYHARLIRCKSNVAFVGKVHEMPNINPNATVPHDIFFELDPTHHGQKKTKERWLQDRDFLLEELQENPENPRTVYYLAQTYFCLQDWDNAIKWYEKRITMNGYSGETFLAHYMLAEAYGLAGNEKKMVNAYLKAFSLRPHRAEPLIKLAQHYYNIGAYNLCYVFAKYAVSMPYLDDFAPSDKWLYDFVRYSVVSATAGYFKEYQLGKQATLQALKVCPNDQTLQNNLNFYQTALGEK